VERFLRLELVQPGRDVVRGQHLVGDDQIAKGERRLERPDQLEAQLPAEQRPVITHAHREAHRQPRQRVVEAVAADRQVVGAVQHLLHGRPLLLVVLGGHEQLQALVVAHTVSVDPGALPQADQPRRQVFRPDHLIRQGAHLPRDRVVPGAFRGDSRPGHDKRRAGLGPAAELILAAGQQRHRLVQRDVVSLAQRRVALAEVGRHPALGHHRLGQHIDDAHPQRFFPGVLVGIAQVLGVNVRHHSAQVVRDGKAPRPLVAILEVASRVGHQGAGVRHAVVGQADVHQPRPAILRRDREGEIRRDVL